MGLYKALLASAVAFVGIGTGAVQTDLQSRGRFCFYPSDYGAIGDSGSHPLSTRYGTLAAAQAAYGSWVTALTQEIDWAACQACVIAAGSVRGMVNLGSVSGGYVFGANDTLLINNTYAPSGLLIFGNGQFTTLFIKNNCASDVIRVTGFHHTLRDFGIKDFLTPTAGFGINMNGAQYTRLADITVDGLYNGLDINTSVSAIWLNRTRVTGITNIGVRLGGGGASIGNMQDCYIAQSGGGLARTGTGIQFTDGGAWLVSNLQCMGWDKGVSFAPTSGQVCASNKFVNSYFDSCNTGVISEPDAASTVTRLTFEACWLSDSIGNGFEAVRNTQGVIFTGCEGVNNGGAAIKIDSATFNSSIHVTGGIYAGNGVCLWVGANVSDWSFSDNMCGPYHGFGYNGSLVYVESGTSDYYRISNNTFKKNPNAAGTLAVTNGSSAVVGTSTSFTSFGTNLFGGKPYLFIAGSWYQINTVTDNTHLTLTTNYTGTTASGVTFQEALYRAPVGVPANALTDSGSGTNAFVINNVGYNPVGYANVGSPPASDTIYTAGHSPEIIYFAASTSISAVYQNGSTNIGWMAAGANIALQINLGPNETLRITYAGTLTMGRMIH